MDKKLYEAPQVKKVSLDVRNSVLGVCFSSSVGDPTDTCRLTTSCAFP